MALVEHRDENCRKLSELRPHPENAVIFGDPEEAEAFDGVVASIKANGLLEPIVIKPDGTILSGHLRVAAFRKLGKKSIPVRVVDLANYREELIFVVRSNTDRRQLTKGEIALAFQRLRNTPKAEGGTKRKPGPQAKGPNSSASRQVSKRSDEEAADILGVKRDEARALEAVFTTPGVPKELKDAVNKGTVKPTPAARAVKAEVKRQGGSIKNPVPLKTAAAASVPKLEKSTERDHARRVAAEAEAYRKDYLALRDLYLKVDAVLTRRPLKTVLGPTEHHEYRDLIRDITLRTWREIEAVDGPTQAGRQMTLTLLEGGKR